MMSLALTIGITLLNICGHLVFTSLEKFDECTAMCFEQNSTDCEIHLYNTILFAYLGFIILVLNIVFTMLYCSKH